MEPVTFKKIEKSEMLLPLEVLEVTIVGRKLVRQPY